jgi:hypothetical protein
MDGMNPSDVLSENFDRMADLASRDNAVIITGTRGSEFNDEVLSWQRVNGQEADELLPAVLITTRHPSLFRERWKRQQNEQWEPWEKNGLLLIPLKLLRECHGCRRINFKHLLQHP